MLVFITDMSRIILSATSFKVINPNDTYFAFGAQYLKWKIKLEHKISLVNLLKSRSSYNIYIFIK